MKELLGKLKAKENRTALLLVSVAILGILIFILASATLPFKDILFDKLFPKPPSKAATVFPNDPSTGGYVVSSYTRSILATNTAVYFGGQISYAGPNTGQGVPIEASSATRVANYPYVRGGIQTAIPDGNNGWYIGGYFDKVGSRNINYLAHILSDGTVDPNFSPPMNWGDGGVNALVLSQDKTTLYVGGEITIIGGQARKGLAAVNAVTGAVTSFDPGVIHTFGSSPPGSVNVMILSSDGSTLYIGGYFESVGGQTRNNLAAINLTDGTVVTSFNPD